MKTLTAPQGVPARTLAGQTAFALANAPRPGYGGQILHTPSDADIDAADRVLTATTDRLTKTHVIVEALAPDQKGWLASRSLYELAVEAMRRGWSIVTAPSVRWVPYAEWIGEVPRAQRDVEVERRGYLAYFRYAEVLVVEAQVRPMITTAGS